MNALSTVGDVFSDPGFSAPANSLLWRLGALEEQNRERTGFLIMPKRSYEWHVDSHECYRFDNAALDFGPRDQTAHFLRVATQERWNPNMRKLLAGDPLWTRWWWALNREDDGMPTWSFCRRVSVRRLAAQMDTNVVRVFATRSSAHGMSGLNERYSRSAIPFLFAPFLRPSLFFFLFFPFYNCFFFFLPPPFAIPLLFFFFFSFFIFF